MYIYFFIYNCFVFAFAKVNKYVCWLTLIINYSDILDDYSFIVLNLSQFTIRILDQAFSIKKLCKQYLSLIYITINCFDSSVSHLEYSYDWTSKNIHYLSYSFFICMLFEIYGTKVEKTLFFLYLLLSSSITKTNNMRLRLYFKFPIN